MATKKHKRDRKPRRAKTRQPSIPKVDALQQALNKPAWGKHSKVTFREVVTTDLAWLHWLYRQKRKLLETTDPSYLTIALLCKHYPLGIDDEAERELARGEIYGIKPEAHAALQMSDDDDEEEGGDNEEDEEDDEDVAAVVLPVPKTHPSYDPVAETMYAKIAPVQGCFIYGVDSDKRVEVDLVREFTGLRIVFLRPGNDPPKVVRGTKHRLAVLDAEGYLCFLPDDIRFFFKSKKRGALLDYPYEARHLRRYTEAVRPIVVDDHIVKWPSVEDLALAASEDVKLRRGADLAQLLKLRGTWHEGYTSEDVTNTLRLIAAVYPGLTLGVVWNERRSGMCTGDSDLYFIKPDGTLAEAPDSIRNFLFADADAQSLPTSAAIRQHILHQQRNTAHGFNKPIYVGDYNYVWDVETDQAEIDNHEDRPVEVHATTHDEPLRPLQEHSIPAVPARDDEEGTADVLPVPDVRADRPGGEPGADQPTGEGEVDWRTDATGEGFREAGTIE